MKPEILWPNNNQSCAMICVMLDAEYIWLEMDKEQYDTPKHRSMGEYGPKRGVERILSLLDEFGLKATFFAPAAFSIDYKSVLDRIVASGHEIAMHGYYHEKFSRLTDAEQEAVLNTGRKKLQEATGQPVNGFRLPEGECTNETLRLIAKAGFKYDNSFFDNDIPYTAELYDGHRIVEIPQRWEMLDFAYLAWGGTFPKGGDRIAIYDDVLDIWLRELEASYNYGYCYVLSVTPQTIGSPGRMFMLRTMLQQIRRKNIWLATGEQIEEHISSIR